MSTMSSDEEETPPTTSTIEKSKPETSGLFDSDSEDESKEGGESGNETDDLLAAVAAKKKQKKPAAAPAHKKKSKKKKSSDDDSDGGQVKLSRKEKMEKLKAKKLKEKGVVVEKTKSSAAGAEGDDGYDSGDSYNSGGGNIAMTKEDRDFLDMEGEDEELVKEYFQEQKFDDERGEDFSSNKKKKKKRSAGDNDDSSGEEEDEDKDNPIQLAVNRMKKKKRVERSLNEREEAAKDFVERMHYCADEDAKAISERRPATSKLMMLPEVQDMIAQKDMMRPLLDYELLSAAKSWIEPLSNGQLGNITVREGLVKSIATMNGEYGITPGDLKRSSFGKVVMSLYLHKSETPAIKRLLKALIEQWSRPIFNKSGSMRDLERIQAQRKEAGYSTQAHHQASTPGGRISRQQQGESMELHAKFSKSANTKSLSGSSRVSIPYSKGFQFSIRPQSKFDDEGGGVTKLKKGGREALNKRLDAKKVGTAKRGGGHLSIEGRAPK